MVRVEIDSIRVSLMSQDRVVVLKDVENDRYLPIWIGPFEAEAIRVELQGVPVQRPLTHDLIKSIVTELGAEVEHILVSDLRNEVFYARIRMTLDGKTIEIDSRPSDAIAFGVRVKAPIYVADSVMEKASIRPEEEVSETGIVPRKGGDGDEVDEEELGAFKDFLDTLDLDDLGDN
jgi:hypothetical protein